MQATITINTDKETKEKFNNFCKKLGLDISTAFNLFMKNTLQENKIPFVYKILTIEEIKEAVCSIAPKYGIILNNPIINPNNTQYFIPHT